VVGSPGAGSAVSPQLGAVHVVPGAQAASSGSTIVLHAATPTLASAEAVYARFGWSTVAVDLNGDGIDDLAVGSPVAGWGTAPPSQPTYPYTGRVDVYFGHRPGGLSMSPDVTIVSGQNMTQLGQALAAGDLNQDGLPDLIMGAPLSSSSSGLLQAGRLFGLYASTARFSQRTNLVAEADSDATVDGQAAYTWFGAQAKVVVTDATGPLLLVGAPHFRTNSSDLPVGALFAYSLPDLKPAASIYGVESMSGFAAAFDVGVPHGNASAPVLAVAAPTSNAQASYQRGGRVFLAIVAPASRTGLTLQERAQAHSLPIQVNVSAVSVFADLQAALDNARIGQALLFSDVNGDSVDDLVLAQPFGTGASGNEAGSAMALFGSSTRVPFVLGVVNNTLSSANWSAAGASRASRLGQSLAAYDLDGDGVREIIAGALSATVAGGAEAGGEVVVFRAA
jgi:hypothetical protein